MDHQQDRVIFKDIDYSDPDILRRTPFKHRRSPIVVTLADVTVTPVDLQKMMEAGMNVARIRMAYSTPGEKIKLMAQVDKAASNLRIKYGVPDWPVATSVELKTCIVRTGMLEEDVPHITFKDGFEVILTNNIAEFNKCNRHKIFVDNSHLVKDIKAGVEICLDSAEIMLRCLEAVDDKSIKCIVTKGGNLRNMVVMCARGVTHTRPFMTNKDLQLLKFALQYQVDMIAINYVRHVQSVLKVKEYIGKKIKKRPFLFSGICTEQCLDNIDDILKETDGVILSREYLPYELDNSKKYRMAIIQKWVAAKCIQAGKPLFLAGGVFEQNIAHGICSDNEVADVTHAVFDGVTGFILRDCEHIDQTIKAIKDLNEVLRNVEPYTSSKTNFWCFTDQLHLPLNAAEACMMSCVAVANQVEARAILLPTVSGRTVKSLLWMRPTSLIIAVTNCTKVSRILHTFRCVVPLLYSAAPRNSWHETVDAKINHALEYAVKRSWLHYGDSYVTLQRGSEGSSFCDMVRIWTVMISKKPLVVCDDPTEDKKAAQT